MYEWHQSEGPPVELSDATAVRPTFTVPMEGFDDAVLVFELTVSDEQGLKGTDACQVTVQNQSSPPPVDTDPPVLQITTPSGDVVWVSNSRITISGTASDNQQVDRVVWVTDDGRSGMASGTERWYIGALRLHGGTNTITITAYDTDGNSQSKTITANLSNRRWRWRWR